MYLNCSKSKKINKFSNECSLPVIIYFCYNFDHNLNLWAVIDNHHRLRSLFHFDVWSWSNTSSSIKSFPSVSASTLFQHQMAMAQQHSAFSFYTLCTALFLYFSLNTFFNFFSALIWWSPFNWIPLCGKNY